jgi:very-short-patch-repair endonuclease
MSVRLSEAEYRTLRTRTNGLRPQEPRPRRAILPPTDAAIVLFAQILQAGLPGEWFREFTFHESRHWRLDVACPARKLGIEVDGGVHRIKGKFLRDMEKWNALTFAGWRVVRVTPEQVRTGEALTMMRAFLDGEIHPRG